MGTVRRTMLARLFALMSVVLGAGMWTCAPTSAEPLPQPPPGGSLGLALGVSTVPNLRDIGGYRTRDGEEVARGLVYRSDAFIGMSAEDIKKIEPLGLKNDYDLRVAAEAKAEPDELPPNVRHHLLNVMADLKPAALPDFSALLASRARPMPSSATARSRRYSSRAIVSSSRCRAPTEPTGRCSFRWPTARTCRQSSIARAARTAPGGPQPPC